MLLELPREVITREELKQRLWPADTFVDFENGLNKAINKLREALGDSAEKCALCGDFAAARLPVHRARRDSGSWYRRPHAFRNCGAKQHDSGRPPVLMEPRAAVSSPGLPAMERERTQRNRAYVPCSRQ